MLSSTTATTIRYRAEEDVTGLVTVRPSSYDIHHTGSRPSLCLSIRIPVVRPDPASARHTGDPAPDPPFREARLAFCVATPLPTYNGSCYLRVRRFITPPPSPPPARSPDGEPQAAL